MRKILASFLAPITLLEWGGILLYFYLSGRLQAFLHPSFRPQVLAAGILLVFCGVILLLTRNEKGIAECASGESCPEPGRSSFQAGWLFPIMLLLPLGIAATFTRDAFGSQILATRGIADTASALPGIADKYARMLPPPTQPTVEPTLPTADSSATTTPPAIQDPTAADFFKPNAAGNMELNVADLLYAAEDPALRTPFEGKSAEVIGQFMPAKTGNPTGSRFKLVRLFMTCCAADAQPISLLIDSSTPPPKNMTEMAWTKVTGKVTFLVENGRTITVIQATKIELVDPPEETMLF